MPERSTARSTDVATGYYDDSASGSDSWISRRSRLAARDSDSSDEWQEAGSPPWREEPYQPGSAHEEYEGRHARHRAHQQYEYEDEHEQYDGAYRRPEHAYRRSDPLAYPQPGYHEPDQAYQEEFQAQEPYGPADAYPVREDAYVAQQEWHTRPEDHTRGAYPRDDYAGRVEYRHDGADARAAETDEDIRPRRRHSRELDTRPRPANRRRLWLPVGGLALGALLCTVVFLWDSGRSPEAGLPVSAATTPTEAYEEPSALAEPSAPPSSATAPSSSAPPSATPSVTASASPSATPSVTASASPSTTPSVTPAPTQSPVPVLLGPSGGRGVENMVQRYCDRHSGGSADPRNDGRWQCSRLFSSSIVDMDVACRDTYGSGAFARTSDPDDAYAWRCYR